ncbi:ABC transporter G family member 23 isoform X3 [Nerophis ophidion]|nr:ABC transporter G family member 23 isoform X3 [Nerophis ophidion]
MQGSMKGDLEAPQTPLKEAPAILCRDVCRSFGKLKVLNNLNLTVPQGHIYGLLGPSGCGKTTLLKCIVGTLKIPRGHISVLGKPPGFPGHGVPGKMVGYMPQELALYNEFTISDTLTFFGRIHGLTWKETKERMDFLIKFLDLPEKHRVVRNLSGGEMRRVSLGAALLQTPELLILDEPTVGVDPVLRAKIWQHLVDIVKTGKVSVIITTHYIEEARQANMVGLMRNGYLLAEGPPDVVMKQHGSTTLEYAFLQLCETSDRYSQNPSSVSKDSVLVDSQSFERGQDESRPILGTGPRWNVEDFKPTAGWRVRARHMVPKWRNIAALTIKTLVRMKRMPGSLCFQFLLPVIQITLICLCVGGDPKGIQVAVVNNETSPNSFSRSLLSFLDNSSVQQVQLSHEEAFRGIQDGKYWGIIGFGENFTTCLFKRMLEKQVSKEVVDGGSVHVWLDQTNRQIAVMLQQKLLEAFQTFVKNKMGNSSYLVDLPIQPHLLLGRGPDRPLLCAGKEGGASQQMLGRRCQLDGNDAGSPIFPAAGHQCPDHSHVALHLPCLQDAQRRLSGADDHADRAPGHHRHLLRPRHLRRHRQRAERQPGGAGHLLPQPHHERYHLAGGVHPLSSALPQPGSSSDLRLGSPPMHHVSRLGPESHDGVARLRRHFGLEHVFPHPGHGHLEAQDVNASRLLSRQTHSALGGSHVCVCVCVEDKL